MNDAAASLRHGPDFIQLSLGKNNMFISAVVFIAFSAIRMYVSTVKLFCI